MADRLTVITCWRILREGFEEDDDAEGGGGVVGCLTGFV